MVPWCYDSSGCLFMAYFLKKTKTSNDIYLQIYESFYDPDKKGTAHRSFKPVGYVKKLIDKGIEDPIAFYQDEVDRLNAEANAKKSLKKQKLISDVSPEHSLGYFPLKNINDGLHVKRWMDLMQSVTGFRFNVYDMMSSLVYARLAFPCSKSKTYDEVFPQLYEKCDFSLDQLYEGLEYIGQEYEKIIEIYTHAVSSKYHIDTRRTYFDCTNFYFEIDKEDDFRKKGPSKENRHDPIVGLGLMLDADQIPIGMSMFPGNESEKPVLRDVIDTLKARNNITGRTIQVADKGLNCAENIFHAKEAGDGYIFSKSVKMLPSTEKTWVLLNTGYKTVNDKDGNELFRIKECIDEFPYEYTDGNGVKHKITLTEKRIATYNPKLAKKKIFEIDRQVEKAKKLKACAAKKNEYGDSSKYVKFLPADKKGKTVDGKVNAVLNEDAILEDKKLAGYNVIVTSEIKLSALEIYTAYHNLWRIEESFKVMKSQLDARPVYLQKEDTIKGHFLICYLAILLLRLFQFKVLENKYSTETVVEFIKGFRTVKISDTRSINLTRSSGFITDLAKYTGLPIDSYYLNETDIKKMLNHRF